MSGYSNYSLHQKYTSVQGQILTLNQQVANNTSPTLASVLTNSNDAGNQSIQNVANIDSDTIDTQTLRIIGTSSNTSQISVNATGDLVIDDDQDVIVDIGNKFTVQNNANSNISLDVDTNNNKVSIGGAVDSANTHKLQVQGNIETSGVTLTNNLNSSSLTVTGSGHAQFTAKNGDLLLDSLTGDVVVDNVDFVVRDSIGGEKIRVDVTNDRVTVPKLDATDLTIGNIQVFNTSGVLNAFSLKNNSNTFSVDATGILSAATVSAGGYQNSNATFSVSGAGALTASSISNGGNLTFTSSSFPKLITASTGFEFCENSSTTPFLKLDSSGANNSEVIYTSEGIHAFRCNNNLTNRMFITNNDVQIFNPLTVTGTATLGSTSVTDLTIGGGQVFNSSGDLTAPSITTGGILGFTSNSTTLGSTDRIRLRDSSNSNRFALGVASSSTYLTTSNYIDFVHRATAGVSNTTTPKLRFRLDLTNPQIYSSVTNGHIEFWRDANNTPTKYFTLSSNNSNDTVLTSEGSFSLNTDTTVNGALTASSITTSGSASTGALTASSISNGGDLNLTSTGSPLIKFATNILADRILLQNNSQYYALGMSSASMFLSTGANVDLVYRTASTLSTTDFALRFRLDQTYPRLVSGYADGSIEFQKPTISGATGNNNPFLRIHSTVTATFPGPVFNYLTETIYQGLGLHAFRCDGNTTNRMLITSTSVSVNNDTNFVVSGPGVNYLFVEPGATTGVGHTNGHVQMVDSEITDGSFHISSSTGATLRSATGTAEGAYMGWNDSGDGATQFLNSSGTGAGGFKFHNRPTSSGISPIEVVTIGGSNPLSTTEGGIVGHYDNNATLNMYGGLNPITAGNSSGFSGANNYVGQILRIHFTGITPAASTSGLCLIDIDFLAFPSNTAASDPVRLKSKLMLWPYRWYFANNSSGLELNMLTTNYKYNNQIENNNATFHYTTATAAPFGRPYWNLDLVNTNMPDSWLQFSRNRTTGEGTCLIYFHVPNNNVPWQWHMNAKVVDCSELNANGCHVRIYT